MPTSTKSRYTSSNAYNIPAEMPKRYPYFDDPVTVPKRTAERVPEQTKKEEKSVRADRRSMLKIAGIIAGVFLVCALMVYRYAMILEANDTITAKQKEYNGILAQNQLVEKEIEKHFETSVLEKTAMEQLGMVKVDATQVIYVDLNASDSGESIEKINKADEKAASLMGTPGMLIRAFQMLK